MGAVTRLCQRLSDEIALVTGAADDLALVSRAAAGRAGQVERLPGWRVDISIAAKYSTRPQARCSVARSGFTPDGGST